MSAPPIKPHAAADLFARAHPDDFTGDKSCAECHPSTVNEFAASPHAAFMQDPKLPVEQRGCEGCHGPGKIHQADKDAQVISFTKMTPAESNAACLRCHAQTMSESHWKRTEHARAGLACVTCHQIHPSDEKTREPNAPNKGDVTDAKTNFFVARRSPKAMLKSEEAQLCAQCHATQAAEFKQAFHHPVPEGRVVCSDCHTPHPSKDSKVRAGVTYKEKCVTCHNEKAGPFVFEHDPVAGSSGTGCLECHRPHGANNPMLLVATTRGLCGQCHTDKLASSHHPGQTCWSAGCHVSTHGSNINPDFLDQSGGR
ncbi:MAG: hypothetical protein JSS72_06545 [Armatimonadetes bacterium]|nr:hypothetical protein [Armatimonadota bacterium]